MVFLTASRLGATARHN